MINLKLTSSFSKTMKEIDNVGSKKLNGSFSQFNFFADSYCSLARHGKITFSR